MYAHVIDTLNIKLQTASSQNLKHVQISQNLVNVVIVLEACELISVNSDVKFSVAQENCKFEWLISNDRIFFMCETLRSPSVNFDIFSVSAGKIIFLTSNQDLNLRKQQIIAIELAFLLFHEN